MEQDGRVHVSFDLDREIYDDYLNGRCTVGIWFKPLQDDVAHSISKKFQLYKD